MNDYIERIKNAAGNPLSATEIKRKMDGYFESGKIVIYGAGALGSDIFEILTLFGMGGRVACFLDRNAAEIGEYRGLPVYTAENAPFGEKERKEMVCLFSVGTSMVFDNDFDNERDASRRKLSMLGYRLVKEMECVATTKWYSAEATRRYDFNANIERPLETFNLMSDETSQRFFTEVYTAYTRFDFESRFFAGLTLPECSYFRNDIPMSYRTFIDCGAGNGDTLVELSRFGGCETYMGLEPDPPSFTKLSREADNLESPPGRIMLLPLAVSDSFDNLKFYSAGGASMLSKNGEIAVTAVRLDDLLKSAAGATIKMDIEGGEFAALNGARTLLTRDAPDLAICLYHRMTDLWEIPLMLHEWVPEYRFYLRGHHPGRWCSVLYASTSKI